MHQVIFLPESTSGADSSYGVHTAPVCNHMHQDLCARYKSQTLAAIPLFGHTKILHTLIGMGRAALATAVPYPSKVTELFPTRDNEVLIFLIFFYPHNVHPQTTIITTYTRR